jgi:hypothetical protein
LLSPTKIKFLSVGSARPYDFSSQDFSTNSRRFARNTGEKMKGKPIMNAQYRKMSNEANPQTAQTETCTNEPNFQTVQTEICENEPNQIWKPKSFFAKQTQFLILQNRPNSFSCSGLPKAGGWMLSQKQTQNKPNLTKLIAGSWGLVAGNCTNEPNFHLSGRPKGIRTFPFFPFTLIVVSNRLKVHQHKRNCHFPTGFERSPFISVP